MQNRSEYQTLDDGDEQFSTEIHSKISWDHIQNLDKFFSNVYYFHQQNGFYVTFIEFILQLLKFFFIIWIISVMIDLSFINFHVVSNNTIIYEVFYNPILFKSKNTFTSVFVGLSLVLLLIFFINSLPKLKQFYSISKFFRYALKINDDVIADKTWADILKGLEEIQKELQLSVHKPQLTTLDIYQRILRRQNYLIAMANHDIIPTQFSLPLFGEVVIVTKYYLDSIKFLLFKYPFKCPFGDHWQLRTEYKNLSQRKKLADQIQQMVLVMAFIQLLMSPFSFLYLLITKACTYGHGLRINPGHFVSREVTPLGRLLVSHYNELPHEFTYRVSRACHPINQYLDSFVNKIVTSLARLIRFLSGGVIVIGFLISMFEARFLLIPNVMSIAVMVTVIYSISSKLIIPDDDIAVNPQLLMTEILAHLHYIPDDWKIYAHTRSTYSQIAKRFQPRIISIVKELLSCFWTPLIFIILLYQNYSYKMIDFLRNFTTEVNGVGDICSYAMMDVNKYGSNAWSVNVESNNRTPLQPQEKSTTCGELPDESSDHGRIELSLLNFHANNPQSKLPDNNAEAFVNQIKQLSPQGMTTCANTTGQGVHLKNANKSVRPSISITPAPTQDVAFSNYFHNHSILNNHDTSSIMWSVDHPLYRSQYHPLESINYSIYTLHNIHDRRMFTSKNTQSHNNTMQPLVASSSYQAASSQYYNPNNIITEEEGDESIQLPPIPPLTSSQI